MTFLSLNEAFFLVGLLLANRYGVSGMRWLVCVAVLLGVCTPIQAQQWVPSYNQLIHQFNAQQWQTVANTVTPAFLNKLPAKQQRQALKTRGLAYINLANYPAAERVFHQWAQQVKTQVNPSSEEYKEARFYEALASFYSYDWRQEAKPSPSLLTLQAWIKTGVPSLSQQVINNAAHSVNWAYRMMGVRAYTERRFEEAVAFMNTADEFPAKQWSRYDQAMFLSSRARAHFRLGDVDNAKRYYAQVVSLNQQGIQLPPKAQKSFDALAADLLADLSSERYALDEERFRWHDETGIIRVYLERNPSLENWQGSLPAMVMEAFQTWKTALDLPFRYEETSDPASAHIQVSWHTQLDKVGLEEPYEQKGDKLGFCTNRHQGKLLTEQKLYLALQTPEGKPLSNEYLQNVALHETGHSIGLTKHSPSPLDVMYRSSTLGQLSKRDIATARALYQQTPDYSNHPTLTPSQTGEYLDLINKATLAGNEKHFKEANRLVAEAEALSPTGEELERTKAVLLFQQRRLKEAVPLLEQFEVKKKALFLAYGYADLWRDEPGGFLWFGKDSEARKKTYKRKAQHYANVGLRDKELSAKEKQGLTNLLMAIHMGEWYGNGATRIRVGRF